MILKIIIGTIASIGLLYIAGWNIIWSEDLFSNKSYFFNESGFVFLFNGSYYGGGIESRFFDSPAISWVCFMLAIGSLTSGGFLVGYFEHED